MCVGLTRVTLGTGTETEQPDHDASIHVQTGERQGKKDAWRMMYLWLEWLKQ